MSIEQTFKIRVGSEQHRQIMAAFRARKSLAERAQNTRRAAWKRNEEIQQAYVRASENDRSREVARRNGEPQYTTIEVPYSYAMMLTLHTYITEIFLSRAAVFQVMGRHGESEHSVMAVEAVLDYTMVAGRNLPMLYVWLLDPLRYGMGVVGHFWDEETVAITRRQPVARTFLDAPVPGSERVETIQELIKGYEGVRLYNVRPQDFLSDPRVALMNFQQGEFCMRFQQLSSHTALQRETNGFYFNVKEAFQAKHGFSDRDMGSEQVELPYDDEDRTADMRSPKGTPTQVNIFEFYWEIIPSEYGLGPGKRPEKWVFTIAEDKVIIGAQPLGLEHNRFPFDVLEYEVGGYSIYNRSVLEIAEPLNDTLTWLFNSHYFNVRKTLNDQFFVDPSMVEMSDLESPNPGRLVRLKPAAYGKPVDQFVKQFPVTDVTRSNMADAQTVSELLQRLIGSNDTTMGAVQSSRATATEVRSATGNAQSRIKTVAEWFGATGFSSLTQNLIQTTQQLYETEMKLRIVGDMSEWGQRYLDVTPESIAGFYDFVPVDGTMPIDRFAQANLWQQIFAGMGQFPQVQQTYDVAKIFAYVAQLAGLKNIQRFKINVMPDGMVGNELQQGNITPIAPGNANEPGQIPGMGATG